MKKIFLPIFALLLSISFSFAQTAPHAFNYQAVARNAAGEILANTAVSIRISILDETASGSILYSETHNPTTNDFGLFSLKIGEGSVVSGTFSTIDWGTHDKFLRVEMDATGGSSYTVMGTTQLLSVPYALYSAQAGNSSWADGADEANYAADAGYAETANSLAGDNDISNTNEIQTLGITGNTLNLSNGGGSVTLPSIWQNNGANIFYNGGKIGVHTDTPTSDLHFHYNVSTTVPYSGSSNIRFQRGTNDGGFYIGHASSLLGTGAYLRNTDGDMEFKTGGGLLPQFTITEAGNLRMGTEGSAFVEIKEITGTTNATGHYTTIDYPSGYNKENTRILSLEYKNGSNNWLAVSHHFADDNVLRYYLGGSITIYHADSNLGHNKPVRIVLMKMP